VQAYEFASWNGTQTLSSSQTWHRKAGKESRPTKQPPGPRKPGTSGAIMFHIGMVLMGSPNITIATRRNKRLQIHKLLAPLGRPRFPFQLTQVQAPIGLRVMTHIRTALTPRTRHLMLAHLIARIMGTICHLHQHTTKSPFLHFPMAPIFSDQQLRQSPAQHSPIQ
jgi:hypothetical protein